MMRRLMNRQGSARRAAAAVTSSTLLLAAASPAVVFAAAADPPDFPRIGSWATYQWAPSVTQEVPVLVQQPEPGGQAKWSVDKESAAPPPIFVTYSIVRGDAKSYVLQIVTRPSLEGPPLSVTQVTVERASGKALRSVIQGPKGLIVTPESGLRPFRQAAVKGATEEVAVPAGRFAAVRAPYRDGSVWVSDQVPALGLARAQFKDGQLELVKSGTAGAQDPLRL